MAKSKNPFMRNKEEIKKKRLKIMFYGATGVGKTTLALMFPNPCIADNDSGAENYVDDNIIQIETIDQYNHAVNFLSKEKHPYLTFIVDPITIIYDLIKYHWHDRLLAGDKKKGKTTPGNYGEFYVFQPSDWVLMHREYNKIIRELLLLDMNIIVTCREKVNYKDGSFMVVDGKTFDAEKNTDYAFDVVLRLTKNRKGEYWSEVIKERVRKDCEFRLPDKFITSFEAINIVYKDIIYREVETGDASELKMIDRETAKSIVCLVNELEIPKEKSKKVLQKFGVEKLMDLPMISALKFLKQLENKKEKQNETV